MESYIRARWGSRGGATTKTAAPLQRSHGRSIAIRLLQAYRLGPCTLAMEQPPCRGATPRTRRDGAG
eukprot:scaffold29666_cov106-Isochrysis_galbana.AAC.5